MNYKRISIFFILLALLIATTSVAFASADADNVIDDDQDIDLDEVDEDLDDSDDFEDDYDDSEYEDEYDESDDFEDDYDDSEYEDEDIDDSDYEDDYEDEDIDDSDYEDDYDESDDFKDEDIDDSDNEDDFNDNEIPEYLIKYLTEGSDTSGLSSPIQDLIEQIRNQIAGQTSQPVPDYMSSIMSRIKDGNFNMDYSGTVFGPSSNSCNEVATDVFPKDLSTLEPLPIDIKGNTAQASYSNQENTAQAAYSNQEDDSNNMIPAVFSSQKEDNPIVQSVSKSIDSSVVVDAATQSENQNTSANASDKPASDNNKPAEDAENTSSGFNYGILALLAIVIVGAFAAYKKFN